LILDSIKKRSLDLKEAAVALSGIDSSLIAYTLSKIGVKVKLFTVGIKDKFNYAVVEKAAEELNLPLELASQEGFKKIFLGQGADELFGGYKKFVNILVEKGSNACFKALFQSVAKAYEVNYERDEKVAAYNMIELRLPYTDWNLIEYAIKLPVETKIKNEKERKIILRKAANILGLPKNLIKAEKKAIQYETGVHKSLIKILKPNSLEKTFNELFKLHSF